MKYFMALLLALSMPSLMNASAADLPVPEVPGYVRDLYGISSNLWSVIRGTSNLCLTACRGVLYGTNLTLGFVNNHPVIACALGASAYLMWRNFKKKQSEVYCTLSTAKHTYCPQCGYIS